MKKSIKAAVAVIAFAALSAYGGTPSLSEPPAYLVPIDDGFCTASDAAEVSVDLPARASLVTGSLRLALEGDPTGEALKDFIADSEALAALGKAFFWEQQVGSDGQACASCHFHAGADNRSRNQLNPGLRNQTSEFPDGDTLFGNTSLAGVAGRSFGPNRQLTHDDFPLHRLADPNDRDSAVLNDTNDVVTSQGVFAALFSAIGIPFDFGVPDFLGLGAIFSVLTGQGPALVRSSPPRHTPSAVNATLNDRNFWDGRARSEFNGVTPIGDLDAGPLLARATRKSAKLVEVWIERASTASQAVGPVLSNLEMHFSGGSFPEVGRKLLDNARLVPLGLQQVAPDDSLLGPMSGAPSPGLATTYSALIKRAFSPRWWDAPGWVIDVSGAAPVALQGEPGPSRFSFMEFNFTLFFGLAVRAYEQRLVSDDAPFDRYLEGDVGALDARQQAGLAVFVGRGRCAECHSGPELTNASVRNARRFPIERMLASDGDLAVYDTGFYNIGVRPTLEDIGLGGRIGPSNLPLSEARLAQAALARAMAEHPRLSIREAGQLAEVPRLLARPQDAFKLLQGLPMDASQFKSFRKAAKLLGLPDPAAAGVPGESEDAVDLQEAKAVRAGKLLVKLRNELARSPTLDDAARARLEKAALLLPDPVDPGPRSDRPFAPPLQPGERVLADGAFKVPSLRNVALTAPYFHNGGQATLEQVIDFYNRGSDFGEANGADLAPHIEPLHLTDCEKRALVAFLESLTDERVRDERAPFDHPSLSLPNGGTPDSVGALFGVPVLDDRLELPMVGTTGHEYGLGTSAAPEALKNFLQQ